MRWEDLTRQDNDTILFGDDELRTVNGALLRLYNSRGALNRIFTTDDLDNGVFVFTNLPPDKYKLELYYGDNKLYNTVKVNVKRNQTSYKNLMLRQDQKPKKH